MYFYNRITKKNILKCFKGLFKQQASSVLILFSLRMFLNYIFLNFFKQTFVYINKNLGFKSTV